MLHVPHAKLTKRIPEDPRMRARLKYHVLGSHKASWTSESHFYACNWCTQFEPYRNEKGEIHDIEWEQYLVPASYPDGVAGFFKDWQSAVKETLR